MSSVNFDDLSLAELKQMIRGAAAQVARMRHYEQTFANAANTFSASGEHVAAARDRVSAGWDGKASDAASGAMSTMHRYMAQSRTASTTSAHSMQAMANTTHKRNTEAQSIPHVDTSFGASMRAHGNNPFAAIPDNMHRHEEASQNHAKAVQVASSLNESGMAHSHSVRSANWPDTPSSTSFDMPPDLPPPPAAPSSSAGGSGSPGSSPSYSGGPSQGSAVPVIGVPGGRGYHPTPSDPGGPTRGPGPGGGTVPIAGGGSATNPTGIDLPTVPGGGAGAGPTPSAPGGGSTTVGAGGALAGVGMGVTGGIAGLGGRIAGSPGELAGRGSGSGSGVEEGNGGRGAGRGGAVGEGERVGGRLPGSGARLGSGSGAGETESPRRLGAGNELRRGASAGAEPLEGRPGAPGEGGLRTAGPGGAVAAEELAASRGGMGMPMGGGAGRRGAEDEEHKVPDYLVESDDFWAGEQSGSPAVIGE